MTDPLDIEASRRRSAVAKKHGIFDFNIIGQRIV